VKDRFTRLAPSADESATQTAADTFRFVFSNEKVGRDGHVVLNRGIQTTNFLRNPVVLWAHDDQQPPIGRGSNIDTSGINARLDVTFAPRETLPFAATIRDLVAGKWLRALSMSWQPLEWSYSSDKSRPPGGVDFTRVDLLEVSVVPLPALPDALLDARSCGIDTAPLREWAARALDTRMYRGIPRRQLEQLYGATGTAISVRRPRSYEDPARADRQARLLEIQNRGERMERARRLRAGEAAHYAGADRAQLKRAQKHQKRAARHQQTAVENHAGLSDRIDELASIQERASETLAEFGERSASSKMQRHLDALDRCVRAVRASHADQQDSLLDLGHYLGKATECVSNVLDDNEDEPAGVADEAEG
jgi:hypothetical protein